MKLYEYNREKAVSYAIRWALGRNPRYADFEKMGGDCTNFASQVVHAGGCPMNYNKYGWYFRNLKDRAPAWTSVEYFYQFLINNRSIGPVGEETDIYGIEIGDIVQINFQYDYRYDHSPVVIDIKPGNRMLDSIFIAAHTIDRIYYPLSNYNFKKLRFIHIKGFRR
ncbi:amidase domain-containing protein [Crassaminicella thermophila]|uniref:Amidase domain-containing protein n=1 Tax=Crassaminicella thermophila TaxID=2599308 RepID=A0A5C0SGE9_CRATE|nr:amidase domain-containing protein [Crassaminicella thermophila]QEK12474.1 amidase domain-containing protein [Crassaminicella thermophila]